MSPIRIQFIFLTVEENDIFGNVKVKLEVDKVEHELAKNVKEDVLG